MTTEQAKGHDLRNPLQAIQMTASYLAALNAGAQISQAASRLINSGARMKALLDDLLDFARTQLGEGINIVPAPIDVAKLFAGEVEQLRAAYPDVRLELEVIGESQGLWDGLRLQQLLGNLVVNAIKYGAPDTPVRVRVVGQGNELHFEVRNFGPSIEQSTLDEIFEPLKRGPHRASRAAVTVAAGTNAPNSVPSASASAPCAGPNAVAVLSTINASLIKLE